jgi:uncharacterized membrane protein
MWQDPSTDPSPGTPPKEEGTIATMIYVLYLAGLVVGITPLIGLVMAYVYRDGAPHWLRTHYHFQIRTFWIGLVFILVGAVTTGILIGFLILVFWLMWYVVRCVRGLKLAGERRPVPNPLTWGF